MSDKIGINTLRDANRLWENYAIEDVATIEAFKRNPSLVLLFYNERRKQLRKVLAKIVHHQISKFQTAFQYASYYLKYRQLT